MTIKQSITLGASPAKVYAALTSAAEFGKATGAPAEIGKEEGDSFSCFGGQITGRHLELKPGERIVQAWRAGPWPEGHYSIVRFDLQKTDAGTKLELHHAGFPEGGEEHLSAGWKKMYWDPLTAYLE